MNELLPIKMLIAPGHLHLISPGHLFLSLNFYIANFVLYEGENKFRVMKYRQREDRFLGVGVEIPGGRRRALNRKMEGP